MPYAALQIDPRDNVVVALSSLTPGTTVDYGSSSSCPVTENIPAKQKLALVDLRPGDLVIMYGMVVGEATQPIARGGLLSTRNIRHRAGGYTAQRHPVSFELVTTTHAEGIEDRMTMAPLAARRLAEMVRLSEAVVAIELVIACQAIDLRGSEPLGAGTRRAYEATRKLVRFLAKFG